jgi:hypothetical protein
MGTVAREVAEKEFDRWFESKKLPNTRREGKDAESIVNEIVNAIEEGYLVVSDENEMIYSLKFPVGNADKQIDKLTFVNRISAGTLQAKTNYVKSDDQQGRSIATIAALTGEVGGTIRALDSVDFGLAMSITVFY